MEGFSSPGILIIKFEWNDEMEKATNQRIQINVADNQIKQIVANIYHHILRDFIAHANECEVLDSLYRFYTESDLILISKQQLRVYQELEKHSLDLSAFDIKKEK